ncbi:MAG TPA: hypothetical protein VHO47_02950 [Candidatus Babeliales bacterium]|nr:hypothetical protein [Candidatus Babeliales bacterium]
MRKHAFIMIIMVASTLFLAMRYKPLQLITKARPFSSTLIRPMSTQVPRRFLSLGRATILSAPIAALIAQIATNSALRGRFDSYFQYGIIKTEPIELINAIDTIDAQKVGDLIRADSSLITHSTIIDKLIGLKNRVMTDQLTPDEEQRALAIMTAINCALSNAVTQAKMVGYTFSAAQIEKMMFQAWEIEFATGNYLNYRSARLRDLERSKRWF